MSEDPGEDVRRIGAELRAQLRGLQGPDEPPAVIYIAHSADGQVLHIGAFPPAAVLGPCLPQMEDVWAAQAAAHVARDTGVDDQRASAERAQTEAGFNITADREVAALIEDLEAGE